MKKYKVCGKMIKETVTNENDKSTFLQKKDRKLLIISDNFIIV